MVSILESCPKPCYSVPLSLFESVRAPMLPTLFLRDTCFWVSPHMQRSNIDKSVTRIPFPLFPPAVFPVDLLSSADRRRWTPHARDTEGTAEQDHFAFMY